VVGGNGFRGHQLNELEFFGDVVRWVPVAIKGSLSTTDAVSDAATFNEVWRSSPNQILYRKCLDCVASHQDIYYRRFDANGLPTGFDLLDLVKSNWFSDPKISGNTFNHDFKLYSTYSDALADTGVWAFCNFNDGTVGFPRDCGPTGYVYSQWNTFSNRPGAGKQDVGFYVETMQH
jgi:hypothetical protein